MPCKLEKSLKTLVSQCDNHGKISIPNVFSLFGDLASEHAPMIGLGSDVLAEKGLFWIAVRTKIKVRRLPLMNSDFLAESWPEAPGRVRCNRYYSLSDADGSLVEGKTEWAIINLESGRPQKLSEVYPEELIHLEDTVCDEDFHKLSDKFEDAALLGKYTVRSTDIDIGQHMNNAKYIHALFGLFSTSELDEMDITDVEINFRSQAYEGDELSFYIRNSEDGAREIGAIRPDGTVAATIRIA